MKSALKVRTWPGRLKRGRELKSRRALPGEVEPKESGRDQIILMLWRLLWRIS